MRFARCFKSNCIRSYFKEPLSEKHSIKPKEPAELTPKDRDVAVVHMLMQRNASGSNMQSKKDLIRHIDFILGNAIATCL